MNIGIIVLCRFNSTRLPGKILSEIRGRAVISYIVERIRLADPNRTIVVATSVDPSDDPIDLYCRRSGINCFRGSLDDVAGRFLDCAEFYGFDFAVRINGDNLFVDVSTLQAMLAVADTDVFDFVTNVPGRTFPYGMSVEIVRTSFYEEAIASINALEHREHVTSWLYIHPELGKRYVYVNHHCPEAAGLQLALDTPADLSRAVRILDYAGAAPASLPLSKIYSFLKHETISTPWRGASGPLLIAEIGGNHEGNFELAKEMTKLAIASGADCVKFQLYRGDSLVSSVESPDRNKHFKKFELSREQHISLAEMCKRAGVSYLASVWDITMLQWIDSYLDFYKIGSGDLTAWPMLREFAKRGKPILISTGLANFDEIMQTVSFIQRVNSCYKRPEMLCIMQCTSMYPIPDSDANLAVMEAIRESTGVAVGYSDHTIGSAALVLAAAMGAEALEFHFTDTREGKVFRDHKVSLTVEEVKQLKFDIERAISMRGNGVKVPQASEIENKHVTSFRRAVYPRRFIKVGQIISEDDIVILRPAHGTDSRDFDSLIGAIAIKDIKPLHAIYPFIDYEPSNSNFFASRGV